MPVKIQVQINRRNLDELGRRIREVYPRAWQELLSIIAVETKETMQDNMPFRTGWLRQSVVTEVRGERTVLTYPIALYAPFVDQGTKPHIIFPRFRQALHFYIGGKGIFATYVRHPGFAGRHFIDKTKEQMKEKLRVFVINFWKELTRTE
jgi:hypothetical protein